MAGRGPRPQTTRRRTNTPVRGDWKRAPGAGWQHGRIPECPDGLLASARAAWATWMRSWFAAHWTRDDLPVLRQVIKLFDKVERNQASSAELTQYRQLLDSYGITPKGQQDRRWTKPEAPGEPAAGPAPTKPESRYGHLKVVNE